jgi:hypothetical protein
MARLPLWVAALWWGSLTTVGFAVVPLLFTYLPTPAIAGAMAAKLFAAQTWLSVACGLLLLMITRSNMPSAYRARAQSAFIYIVFGMLLALLSEFAVAPRIVARDNLRLWHSVGSLMYLLQWGCAAAIFSKLLPSHPNHQV